MPRKVLTRLLFGSPVLANWPAEVGLLVLRVVGGLGIALLHGWSKIPVSQRFIESVGDNGFPAPVASAWMAALGEFVGGLLLALGLFTRAAALWVAGVMAGAAAMVHGGSFTGERPVAEAEKALLYLAIALCFVLVGSSRTGVDQFFRGGGGKAGKSAAGKAATRDS